MSRAVVPSSRSRRNILSTGPPRRHGHHANEAHHATSWLLLPMTCSMLMSSLMYSPLQIAMHGGTGVALALSTVEQSQRIAYFRTQPTSRLTMAHCQPMHPLATSETFCQHRRVGIQACAGSLSANLYCAKCASASGYGGWC